MDNRICNSTKIHPSVIGYMLSKYNNSGKSEDIQDIGYFCEEPDVGEEHLDRNGCKKEEQTILVVGHQFPIHYTIFERNLEAGKYEGKDVEDIIKGQ